MARRRRLKGGARIRRLFRRLPGAVSGELIVEFNVTGRQIAAAVLARTPRKTGALAGGISYKVLPRSLRLQVGLLGSVKQRRDLFYARIQEFGRKAQIVRAFKRHGTFTPTFNRNGTRMRTEDTTYPLRVRAMAGKRFVTGRYPELRQALGRNLRGIFTRALARIAGGGDD